MQSFLILKRLIALVPATKCAKTSWHVIFGPNWTSVDGPKVKYKLY